MHAGLNFNAAHSINIMTTQLKNFQEPTEQEIAEYAYFLWESEGRIDGRDVDYWLQAKTHLTTVRQHEAGLLKQSQKTSVEKAQQNVPSFAPTNSTKKRAARPTPDRVYA